MSIRITAVCMLSLAVLLGCGETHLPQTGRRAEAVGAGEQPQGNAEEVRAIDITFDDLQLDIKKDMLFEESMLTDRVRELDGKIVRIRGFICSYGVTQETDIRRFIMIKNQECKFGPGGEMHHCIDIHLSPEQAVDFIMRPLAVEGKLTVSPMTDPSSNITYAIYRLEG